MVVASTDYDWRQAEERTVIECEECNSNQVQLDCKCTSLHPVTQICLCNMQQFLKIVNMIIFK